jgi:hypothetical protein
MNLLILQQLDDVYGRSKHPQTGELYDFLIADGHKIGPNQELWNFAQEPDRIKKYKGLLAKNYLMNKYREGYTLDVYDEKDPDKKPIRL